MDDQHWVRCEACGERMLFFRLQEHMAACNLYAEMHTRCLRARAAYDTYRGQLQERVDVETILE